MKRPSWLASVGALVLSATSASGYTLYPPEWYCGGSYVHWGRPTDPNIRVISRTDRCITPDGWFPGNPNYGQMMDAGGWAHWMWYREYLTSVVLELTPTACTGTTPRSNWLGGPGPDRYALDRMDDNYGMCPGGSIGCASFYHYCEFFGTDDLIHNARMVIRMDQPQPWAGAAVNSLTDCLSTGVFAETTWSHEVGHNYGLNHFDGWLSIMNADNVGHHNCNIGAGFHPQPFSDETQAMQAVYPRPQTATALNVSGSPKTGLANNLPTVSRGTFTVCGPFISGASVLFMNHYNAIPGGVTQYRAALVPTNIEAPGASSIVEGSNVFTVNSHPGAIYGLNTIYSFSTTATIPPQGVRLWIQLDPYNIIAETDEGDNMIPTDLIYFRGGGPGC